MTHQSPQQSFTLFLSRLPDMRLVSAGLFSLIIVSGISYGYFLNTTVMNVVDRKEGEEKLAELDTDVSSYEFSYIAKTSHITLDDALALGYVEELSPLYVETDGSTRLTYAR